MPEPMGPARLKQLTTGLPDHRVGLGGKPLGLQHQEDASGGFRFTRGIDRLQNTSPQKSAAWQLAGHGGPSQRCVERHQMVCYETQFGQKIAGAFWFLGGGQSSREGGRGLCEVGGRQQLWYQTWVPFSTPPPQHVLPQFPYL